MLRGRPHGTKTAPHVDWRTNLADRRRSVHGSLSPPATGGRCDSGRYYNLTTKEPQKARSPLLYWPVGFTASRSSAKASVSPIVMS